MKVCPDCYAANRSYHMYCQKCSGLLTDGAKNPYPRVKIKKKAAIRRVPTGFVFTL
jgi:hypothetical protein